MMLPDFNGPNMTWAGVALCWVSAKWKSGWLDWDICQCGRPEWLIEYFIFSIIIIIIFPFLWGIWIGKSGKGFRNGYFSLVVLQRTIQALRMKGSVSPEPSAGRGVGGVGWQGKAECQAWPRDGL